MTQDISIAALSLRLVRVTPRSIWTFIEATSRDGWTGIGEATLIGRETHLVESAGRLLPHAASRPPAKPAGQADAAILSALDQALHDIDAKRKGLSVAASIGDVRHAAIPLYANINRRTHERTPEAFAESARRALHAGYAAVKLAPFDEVRPDAPVSALDAGLARIDAVRRVLSSDHYLMVDCHERFTPYVARDAVLELAGLAVAWIESPIAETEDNIGNIRDLRHLANERGARLAGLENAFRPGDFRRFADAGAYDVLMPDVKYIGGISGLVETGRLLSECGVAVSPHNPNGPVSHAASLHAAALFPTVDSLEMQFDETAHFDGLVSAALPPVVDGFSAIPPGPGLGVTFNTDLLEDLTIFHAEWQDGAMTGRRGNIDG
ncbi:mandelate racemase/muconate lactonizing enzyme family protein [Shinella sp. BYT-45]|uniref:mandelate racemase/muconate lactonizing enzyme family protein n=1 Tax=Shinella sp. BYT-45 TaxID=3377377 RepID=UPI0039802941